MLNDMVDEPTNSCYKYKTACPNLTNNKEFVDCIDVDLFGCNIKCEMCVMPRYYSQRDIDNYFKVLDKLKNDSDFSHITPTTVGEPFFHKEKMINFLRSHSDKNNPRMAFLTNATLLTEDYVDEIDVQKVSYMLISFHGISKGVYESIMAGADFDKTLHNVLYLREKNFPITINYIIQEKNLCEPIQDVIDFWKEKDILFRFSVDYRDYPPEKENIKNEVLKKFESVPEIYKDTYILANITNGIC